MKNPEIAKFFYEIANILEAKEVQFKPMAYRKAAMVIETWNKDVEKIYKEKGVNGLKEIPCVGDAIAKKTAEILETGKLKYLDELRKAYPEAFSRPFHPAAGPVVASFLDGGKK